MHLLFRTRIRAGSTLFRRCCIVDLGGLVAACSQTAFTAANGSGVDDASRLPKAPQYSALADEKFAAPSVEADALDSKYMKQRVAYSTEHPPGTVVVDPHAKLLYLVLERGYAIRYGIGVGREGFGWSGTADIRRKAEWPIWTPTSSMIARQPELARYRSGMEPGVQNPLGARALYLFQNGKDTLYRMHGTNEPDSIGKNVSSGCIRLLNQNVIDLYSRLPNGSKVVVLHETQSTEAIVSTSANE